MSKNSAFSSFADATDQEVVVPTQYSTNNDALTVQELLIILQNIIAKDPSAKNTPIAVAELYSLRPAIVVSIENGKVVIADSYV